MRWIGPILREIFGLFVDDGSLALIILGWLTAAALLLPQVPVPLAWRGAALFAGLAITWPGVASAISRASSATPDCRRAA